MLGDMAECCALMEFRSTQIQTQNLCLMTHQQIKHGQRPVYHWELMPAINSNRYISAMVQKSSRAS